MMNEKSIHPFPPHSSSDKEIIQEILSEKESDAVVKDRMCAILYEASSADDTIMDTDLIDECVKAINLIEGHEEHLDQEKMKSMRRKVDQKYKDWLRVQRKRRLNKLFAQSAAGLILVFFMSSAVAGALGYNLIQTVAGWGKETFHLSAQNQPDVRNDNHNIADKKNYGNIEDIFQDLAPKPLLPGWLPDGFAFKYAEKYTRSNNTNYITKTVPIRPSSLTLVSILIKHQQKHLLPKIIVLKKMLLRLQFMRKTTCGTTSFTTSIRYKRYGAI